MEIIRAQRNELQNEILIDEEEKQQIETQIRKLNERLSEVNAGLQKKYATRGDYDRTISETEGAFVKILESSQTLLHVLKKEGGTLAKKKAAVSTQPAKK